jgi:hypothetical protein
VFLKRNRTRHGDKDYESVLLVQGRRVPAPRPSGRPRKDETRGTVVVHETLANLSKLPPGLIALVAKYCEAERTGQPVDGLADGGGGVSMGPVYGPLAALRVLARECGIERALGTSREAQLALFLVLARVVHRGSRLSAVRWAEDQAVAEALGLEPFDEDDLYAALDALEPRQAEIEAALTPRGQVGAAFLYDVTSSYFEGQKNELAAPGYNRDGKKYKKQVVIGLLTDADGEPVSVQVYRGNTADPETVADQIDKLRERFDAKEVVLVGDRGMIRGPGRELLGKHGFRYITSLTEPEVRSALASGTLQLGMFDEQVAETMGADGRRHILRRNPKMTERVRNKRADQLRKVQSKVDARNAFMTTSVRAKLETSVKEARAWLRTYKLDSFVEPTLLGRNVVLVVDEAAKAHVEELDGCYVVITDVPADLANAQTIWDRYGDLQKVERDFRTLKTTLLEIRPIFLRKARRTRAHALVAMLALKLARRLERRVAPLGLTAQDALDRLSAVRLVSLADPALGLWRLPDHYHEPVRRVLNVLPGLPPPRLSRHADTST